MNGLRKFAQWLRSKLLDALDDGIYEVVIRLNY